MNHGFTVVATSLLLDSNNHKPHPLYSGFFYSHPTLIEREKALAGS